MAEAADFQTLQRRFAAHLRDPAAHDCPGLEDRRLKIYRELFYNNVADCLASAFPVLRRISSDAVWHARVRDFYARHRSQAPQFHRVPEEFLRFLEDERGAHPDDPPFLRDLAHYEWAELELSISPLELTPELADPNGDLLQGCPLVSPLAWTLAYDYPVQRIGRDFQPEAPGEQPTFLVVNRDRHDRVRFLEINAVTAALLERITQHPDATGRALLEAIAAELAHPEPEALVQAGAAMLLQLRERDVVLGTRR